MTIQLGAVGHFGLAVRDPHASARWWRRSFDLETIFEGDDYIGLSNEHVTIGHMSFHLASPARLREALEVLKQHHVDLEDPGDEIGPEAPGSPHVGLWFHDPDGYRWELSVQFGGALAGQR